MLIIAVDPNSKSHGRNVRISHWRAQVVTFSRAYATAARKGSAPSSRFHWAWVDTSTGFEGTFFNLMVMTGLSWRYCSSQAICSMDDSTVRTARRVTSVAPASGSVVTRCV